MYQSLNRYFYSIIFNFVNNKYIKREPERQRVRERESEWETERQSCKPENSRLDITVGLVSHYAGGGGVR